VIASSIAIKVLFWGHLCGNYSTSVRLAIEGSEEGSLIEVRCYILRHM